MGLVLKITLVFLCVIFTIVFAAVGIVPSMVLGVSSEEVAQQMGVEKVLFDSPGQITQIANETETKIDTFTQKLDNLAPGQSATLELTNKELTSLIINSMPKVEGTNNPIAEDVSVNIKKDDATGKESVVVVATLSSDSLPDNMKELKDIIGAGKEITLGVNMGLTQDAQGNLSLNMDNVQIGNFNATDTAKNQLEDYVNDIVNFASLAMALGNVDLNVINGQLSITAQGTK